MGISPYITSSIIMQLLTIAIPASLLIYLGRLMEHLGQTGAADFFNGKPWFHTIGALEAVLLLGALALSILAKVRRKRTDRTMRTASRKRMPHETRCSQTAPPSPAAAFRWSASPGTHR